MSDPRKRGICRKAMGFGTQHSVRVFYEPYGPLEIAEDHYKEAGYEPPFDQLPWEEPQAATPEPASPLPEPGTGAPERPQSLPAPKPSFFRRWRRPPAEAEASVAAQPANAAESSAPPASSAGEQQFMLEIEAALARDPANPR